MIDSDQANLRIVAVIQSFNRLELLKKSLDSLIPVMCDIGGLGIAVFEAGSNDGSLEFLEEQSAKSTLPIHIVRPVSPEKNTFSDGVNTVCQFAIDQWPSLDALLLFETDNVIECPTPLASAAALMSAESTVAAVGFTVRKHSGDFAGWGERFPTVSAFLLGPQLAGKLRLVDDKSESWLCGPGFRWKPADIVYTSPLLIRRSVWVESHGLDATSFPFSDCDLDWAWRIASLGYRSAVVETGYVIHDNLEVLSNWSQTRVQRFHEARYKLLARHRGSWIAILKPVLFLRHCVEWMVLAISSPFRPNSKSSLMKRARLMISVFREYR